jgi:DNA-cytosine methyltransferase
MNVLSLFDGMSCGQLALERAGIKYDNYFASEIDKFAIKVTMFNYPKTIQIGDITKVFAKDLPKIDLLIGGSPCQGFSFAGNKLNFDDLRSKLFFEFVRLLNECKPKYFLLENVKMKKEYKDIISSCLNTEPIEINSSLVSAQNRKRYYWTNISNITQPKDLNINIHSILEKNVDNRYFLTEKGKKYIERHTKQHRCTGKSPSLTTKLSSVERLFAPVVIQEINQNRRLTPIECERLQTIPDNYTSIVSNTQRYKMIGNGWTINVIAHIFKNIERSK